MENFVVSARKYRPVRFEEVVGQSGVTTTLQNAIKSGKIAHAYLFCGPRGVGKTTCARILAREVNEFEVDESGEASISLNIHELDAASNNSVDDIRSLVDQVRIPPQSGKYKVYIIDEVHMLSQQAFNAFLKTLEEPPPYAIFILATTEKQKILPTILSRCQIFDFSRITVDDIANHLKGICDKEGLDGDSNALHLIAQKADGALRDALSMFDRLVSYSERAVTYESVLKNLNILDYDYYFKVTDYLLMQDHSNVLLIFDEILRNGFDGGDFIVGLEEHLRNLMVCKDPQTVSLLEVTGSLKERYQQQATLITSTFLLNALSLSNQCELSYKTSNNKRLHVELTLMKLSHLLSVFTPKTDESIVEAPKKNPISEAVTAPETKSIEIKETLAPTATQSAPIKPVADENTEQEKSNSVETESVVSKIEVPEKPVTNLVEESEPIKKSYSAGLDKNIDFSALTGSVSIADLDKKDEKIVAPEAIPGNGIVNIEIDEQLFKQAWNEYLKNLKAANQQSLHHVMSVIEPELEGGEIILTVENKLQRELFENERMSLVDFLEEKLTVKGLGLTIEINKDRANEVERKPFTAKEKFKIMADRNPAVLTLQDKLDLKHEY